MDGWKERKGKSHWSIALQCSSQSQTQEDHCESTITINGGIIGIQSSASSSHFELFPQNARLISLFPLPCSPKNAAPNNAFVPFLHSKRRSNDPSITRVPSGCL